MNVREVYNFLQTGYPKEIRNLNSLAWPTNNPSCGIQFVDSKFLNIRPLLLNPLGYLTVEPLVGPFYELTVVGLSPTIPPNRFGTWKHFQLVVDITPESNVVEIVASTPTVGDKARSASIDMKISMAELKDLPSKLGIHWYHHDTEYPWTLTKMDSLGECVEYERNLVKTRLQLYR